MNDRTIARIIGRVRTDWRNSRDATIALDELIALLEFQPDLRAIAEADVPKWGTGASAKSEALAMEGLLALACIESGTCEV